MSSSRFARLRLPSFIAATALTSVVAFTAACDDPDPDAGKITFEQSSDLFPGLSYDTGLVPEGSPVRASFAISASGAAKVTAGAVVSGSEDAPALTGVIGGGALSISGGFAMKGSLVVDMDGLPSYDGPIPGLDDVSIPVEQSATFDPFAIGKDVTVRADIPPSELPAIPLPGGIPGSLVLAIGEGSYVEVTSNGTSACVSPGKAGYQVALARAGKLVIEPSIQIEVPFVGTQTFDIPSFEVPLDLGTTDLPMSATFDGLGSPPEAGDTITAACDGSISQGGGDQGGGGQGGAGQGGGGTGGGPISSGTGGGVPCQSATDCEADLPCVEGTCSPGGGICNTGLSYGDPELDTCASGCCEQLDSCTFGYTDITGCNDCIAAGGGARCDAYLTCLAPCTGYPICDSGLAAADQATADCLSSSCCAEFEACTFDGTDPEGCYDCLTAGAGARCDQAIECMNTSCP